MCHQWDSVWTCGHRGFYQYENCPVFGTQCLGAGGNHKELKVADICDDCKVRKIMFVGRRATLDNWGKDDPFRHGNRRP